MKNIQSFIWFNSEAEDAAKLYTSTFKNSGNVSSNWAKTLSTMPGPNGKPMGVTIEINGHQFVLFNGGPMFHPTAAISFTVYCQSEAEIEGIWKKLSEGGTSRMSLQKYPFSEKYGWIEDKFGVNWQLNLSKDAQPVTPSFLFCGAQQGNAEKAVHFWTKLFPNSAIGFAAKYEKSHEFEGQTMFSTFTLNGQSFNAMDAGMPMDIPFTEGISMFVNCDTQEEVDRFWNNLSEGGQTSQCGWLKDPYGISWQIVPTALGRLMGDNNREKAGRVFNAMLKMTKLDIAGLERAYNGEVKEPALSLCVPGSAASRHGSSASMHTQLFSESLIMATPNPSITFNGNAEEAFNFYKSVFGGEFASFMRWKDMPGGKTSAEDAEKIMHASLPIGNNNRIMGGDMPSAMHSQLTSGNNFLISLECESKDEASTLYHALLAGGGKEDPMMPLGDAFWGAYAGFLTDKFGVRWMVNYTYPKK